MKLEEVLLFQIDQTNKIAKQYSQKEFDRLGFGITVDQWVLLKIIDESEELSQKELAAKSFRDPASITRSLDILQKNDLIARMNVSGNRRSYNIRLSVHGMKFVAKNMGLINAQRAKSIEGFTHDEASKLLSMLLKIQKNLK
jgi:DNA-binding MarR family transcriptional regulator